MDEKTKQRIEEIQKRLKEYHKHKNDPYAYFEGEIKAVKELLGHAPEDIEFLLNVIDNKIQTKEKVHKFCGKSARAFTQSKMKK